MAEKSKSEIYEHMSRRERLLRKIVDRYYGLCNFNLSTEYLNSQTGGLVVYRMKHDLCINGYHVWFSDYADFMRVGIKNEKDHRTMQPRCQLREFTYAHPHFLDDLDKWMKEFNVKPRKWVQYC